MLNNQASKSFMSKVHDLRHKSLHLLPKFAPKTNNFQVCNGQYVSVLFIMPVIKDINGHKFERLTLVSEIHKNVDFAPGINYIFEL